MPTFVPPHITARIGEEIRLELESLPGAGYEWEVISADDRIELVRREILLPSTETLLPTEGIGASAREILVFVPRKAGKMRLSLRLKRRWENRVLDEVDTEITVEGAASK